LGCGAEAGEARSTVDWVWATRPVCDRKVFCPKQLSVEPHSKGRSPRRAVFTSCTALNCRQPRHVVAKRVGHALSCHSPQDRVEVEHVILQVNLKPFQLATPNRRRLSRFGSEPGFADNRPGQGLTSGRGFRWRHIPHCVWPIPPGGGLLEHSKAKSPNKSKSKSTSKAEPAAAHNDHASATHTGRTGRAIGVKHATPDQWFKPKKLRLGCGRKYD
jgi:hypothetical protein